MYRFLIPLMLSVFFQFTTSTAAAQWISELPLPIRESILWHADHEQGNLHQWQPIDCKYPGGGILNSGGTDALATVTREQSHSGKYAVLAKIQGAFRGTAGARAVRLMRWTDKPWDKGGDVFPKEAYYSTWMYFPRNYDPNKYAPWDPGDGGWWNVFQFKADDANGDSQPTWVLDIERSKSNGDMQFYLTSDVNKPGSYQQRSPRSISVGKWVHVEAFYKVSAGHDGHIVVWHDGERIFDLPNIRTAITVENEHAVWGIGNYTDHIAGDVVEGTSSVLFDDAIVSKRRVSEVIR